MSVSLNKNGEPIIKQPDVSGQMNEIVRHGIDCNKISHYDREEYQIEGMLHFPKDDQPYSVDGCVYCGRCHAVIPDA